MGAGVAYQYKAFISYSHEDEKWAEGLQEKLESYRVDKALHGVPTDVGPVPETLRPIFRDKPDLAAGASLSKKLRDVLDRSHFLIVICSPDAAASAYVNEEIRYFKRQGHSERILTFIVGGEPGRPVSNCFPRALLQRSHAKDDEAGSAGEEPLAADAREGHDGLEIAHLKLIAGILGLPLDVIVQRDQERQAKERFWWHTAVATLALVASVTAGSAFYTWYTTQRANQLIDGSLRSTAQLVHETSRLRDDMVVSAEAAIELLKKIEHLVNEYENYNSNDPRVRLQRARMLLDVARNYGKLKHTREQDRMASQALEKIKGLKGRSKIDEAALTLKAEAHWQRGEAYYGDGKYAEALAEFEAGLKANSDADRDHYGELDARRWVLGPDQYVARARLIHGHTIALMRLNRKAEALVEAIKSVRMGKVLPLDHRNEGDRPAAEMLIEARYLAADLIRQMNNRQRELEAEAYINEGLQDATDLQQHHPKRVRLRSKVATMHLAKADFRRWRGDRVGALEDYRIARKHREHLMMADKSDFTLKADFAFSLIKTGEELNALRKPEEAISELELAEKLYAELRGARPHDRSYRHWQWTAIQGLGEAYEISSSPKAIDYHRRKLTIARERRNDAPTGVDTLLSLAESHLDYGDALITRGNREGGMENLAEARTLLMPAIVDANADWRLLRLQAKVLEAIARARLTTKQYVEAQEIAVEAFALRERDKVRSGKIDPHGQAGLAENRRLIGSIQLACAKCEEAKNYYEQAVVILDRLVREHDAPSPEWLEKYKAARNSLSAIQWKGGNQLCSDEPVDHKMGEIIAMARQLLH